MEHILSHRRTQVLVTVIAAVAATVLALAIKVGSDMAGYLETSVALTADGVVGESAGNDAVLTDAASPFQDAPVTTAPPAVATAPAASANDDAADVRSTGVMVAAGVH